MKVLGTLKGTQLQSKLDAQDRIIHTLLVKVELIEGIDETYILHDWIRQAVTLDIASKQPTLIDSREVQLPYKDD